MNDEVLKRIDALAAKLGTTVDLLVAQYRMRAVVFVVAALVTSLLFVWAARKLWAWCTATEHDHDDDPTALIFTGVLYLCAVIAACAAINYGGDVAAPAIGLLESLR